MKTKIILSIALLFLASCSTSKITNYLVGTYTDNASQGINSIYFNDKTKAISLQKTLTGIENPSFVIANKAKNIIVAVEEKASPQGGKVTSYSYDKKTNTFTKKSSFFTKGNDPCTLAFSPKEDFILVGNYSGGSLTVFPIDDKGELSENTNFIQFEGKSINTQRQEKPHIHCIVFHPKEKVVFVTDLGKDVINIIPYNENSKTFLQQDKILSIKLPAGSGPRHLVFNNAGTALYATFELTNKVALFSYIDKQLTLKSRVSLTPATNNGSAAEIRLSSDEKFLYTSVRDKDNCIVVFKIDKENNLTEIQKIPTGKAPRNFILTKNQKNILVANQDSNLISVYDRDEKTGLLTLNSSELTINKPVYFFPF